MATNWETFPVKFGGGLRTTDGKIEQGVNFPGSAIFLQNFEEDLRGGYTKVLGYQKLNPSEVPGINEVFGVVALSETDVLAIRSGKVYQGDSTTWVDKYTLPISTITRISFDTYKFGGDKKTVIVDGVNSYYIYNHTTDAVTAPSGVPSDVIGAKWVKVFANHVFFAKDRLLTFTAPYTDDDFDTGDGAGVINIGDVIEGLVVFRNQLIVFTQTKIFRISGNTLSDFTLNSITDKTGCIAGHTIQEVGGDIMYLGPDGVRFLSASERENDFGLNRASNNIQDRVTRVFRPNGHFCSITISKKGQYRLFDFSNTVPRATSRGWLAVKFSDQTVNNISWSTLKGFKIYSVDKFQNDSGDFIVFSSDDGYIYRLESSNGLDGQPIEAIFETPYLPISDPKVRKTIFKHTLYTRLSGTFSLDVDLSFDYKNTKASFSTPFELENDEGSSIYGTAIYGESVYGAMGESEFYTNVNGSGFVVSCRYSSSNTNPPYNLNFLILEYRNNERR